MATKQNKQEMYGQKKELLSSGGYLTIPQEFIDDIKNMKPIDVTVYMILMNQSDYVTSKTFISESTIAEIAGLSKSSRKTVHESLERLQELGWVYIEHKFSQKKVGNVNKSINFYTVFYKKTFPNQGMTEVAKIWNVQLANYKDKDKKEQKFFEIISKDKRLSLEFKQEAQYDKSNIYQRYLDFTYNKSK